MKPDWFVNWFASEDYLSVYKHRNSDDAAKLFNLIIKSIELKKNSKVLDAACGAGRHSLAFAKYGFRVTAFDLSKTLLKIAKESSLKQNLQIDFILSDIRTFFLEEKFDLIVNLFTSFGYFNTDEENFLFPQNAYHMLTENGYYVLDYLNKEKLLNSLVPKSEKLMDGRVIVEERKIIDNRVEKKIIIKKGEEEKTYFESVRLYSCDEIVDRFTSIGYNVYKTFGDYSGNKFDKTNSERCLIIFRK